MTADERWLPVVGWETTLEVSDHGRVRRLGRFVTVDAGCSVRRPSRIVKGSVDGNGYIVIEVKRRPASQRLAVRAHVLVLEAFIGPRPEGLFVCHNDGNPANNVVSNLRWGTPSENTHDKKLHGKCHHTNRTHCPREHSLEAPNLVASQTTLGRRQCLACVLAGSRLRRAEGDDFVSLADQYYKEIMAGDRVQVSRLERARENLCMSGRHKMIGDNVRLRPAKSGAMNRECKTCSKETASRRYQAKKQVSK
jgi:hypothetical protein